MFFINKCTNSSRENWENGSSFLARSDTFKRNIFYVFSWCYVRAPVTEQTLVIRVLRFPLDTWFNARMGEDKKREKLEETQKKADECLKMMTIGSLFQRDLFLWREILKEDRGGNFKEWNAIKSMRIIDI